MLIAIEGIDASGKTELIDALADRVADQGYELALFTFPDYTTDTGDIIRQIITGALTLQNASSTEKGYILQSLYNADRAAQAEHLCYAKTSDRVIGISDRYWASGLVYGTVFHGLDENWLIDTNSLLPQPDLWLLLDISAEESFKRRAQRQDEYESNFNTLKHVREHYLGYFRRFAQAERDVSRISGAPLASSFQIIDGEQAPDDVLADAVAATIKTCSVFF